MDRGEADDPTDGPGRTIGSRLRWLLANVANPETGDRFSYQDLADSLVARANDLNLATRDWHAQTAVKQYIWQIAREKKLNPNDDLLAAIADVFQWPNWVFSWSIAPEVVEDEYQRRRIREAARQAGLSKVYARLRERSEAEINTVLAFIEHIDEISQRTEHDAREPGAQSDGSGR